MWNLEDKYESFVSVYRQMDEAGCERGGGEGALGVRVCTLGKYFTKHFYTPFSLGLITTKEVDKQDEWHHLGMDAVRRRELTSSMTMAMWY